MAQTEQTWIVPFAQQLQTRKAYFPPDPRIEPVELLVYHYTAGKDRPMRPQVKAWAEMDVSVNDASTCFVTSRRPSAEPTLQLVPLEARSWHCGGSIWKGRPAVSPNRYSIGVDADNVGYLQKKGGKYVDGYGRPYAGPAPFIDSAGEAWEPYPDEQILELCRITLILVDLFPVLQNRPDRLVGHEDIRSTKRDPGRAFDQFWPVLRDITRGKFPTGLTHV